MRHLPGETIVICDIDLPVVELEASATAGQRLQHLQCLPRCVQLSFFITVRRSKNQSGRSKNVLLISLGYSGGCGNSGWFGGPDDESIFKWKYGH